jgi:hypothetical protein
LAGKPRSLACLACLLLLGPPAALAQQARPSVLAIDTVAAVDEAVDGNGNFATGLLVDAVVSADLGRGFQGIVRPVAMRRGGDWNRQIWVATVRFERSGAVGVRIDGGLIPSPIGLANLTLRPHLNPTISQPASLFASLPPLEARGPRANLIGALYSYGGHVTVSGLHWDARAALIDSSPVRPREVFADANPPRFANWIVGGGVTPFVGFRVGASVTRGGWMRAGESPTITADRDATIVAVESELSFRYTKLAGEWVRDTFQTSSGDRVATGWYVQGQQTLAPRWFVAGRVERMMSPAVLAPLVVDQRLNGVEETLGYRLTPEFTLRLGHRARQGFGRPGYDHQGAVSVVWWKRWM